jgi:ribonuclease HI
MPKSFYAVRHGRKPGIYTKWFGSGEAFEQINKFAKAQYKGFDTLDEAKAFIQGTENTTIQRDASSLSNKRNRPDDQDDIQHSSNGEYGVITRVSKLQKTDPVRCHFMLAKKPSLSSSSSSPPDTKVISHTARKFGTVKCDGAAKSNGSGPSGCGAVLWNEEGEQIDSCFRFLGKGPNNEAEYHGVIDGMRMALKNAITHIEIKLDSNLIVNQMNGNWQVKAENLLHLYEQATCLQKQFQECTFIHIFRQFNKEADALANKAIVERKSSFQN